jgi:endoglucanase
MVDTAQSLDIPCQFELTTRITGTDADEIAFNRSGIPSCIVMVPVRNMHSPVEVVSLKDIDKTVRLITGFIRNLERTGS